MKQTNLSWPVLNREFEKSVMLSSFECESTEHLLFLFALDLSQDELNVCALFLTKQETNDRDIPAQMNSGLTEGIDPLTRNRLALPHQKNLHRDLQTDQNHILWTYPILPRPPDQTCNVGVLPRGVTHLQRPLIPTITRDTWHKRVTQDRLPTRTLNGTVCIPIVLPQGNRQGGVTDTRVITVGR